MANVPPDNQNQNQNQNQKSKSFQGLFSKIFAVSRIRNMESTLSSSPHSQGKCSVVFYEAEPAPEGSKVQVPWALGREKKNQNQKINNKSSFVHTMSHFYLTELSFLWLIFMKNELIEETFKFWINTKYAIIFGSFSQVNKTFKYQLHPQTNINIFYRFLFEFFF